MHVLHLASVAGSGWSPLLQCGEDAGYLRSGKNPAIRSAPRHGAEFPVRGLATFSGKIIFACLSK
jgi:hypothetical protein